MTFILHALESDEWHMAGRGGGAAYRYPMTARMLKQDRNDTVQPITAVSFRDVTWHYKDAASSLGSRLLKMAWKHASTAPRAERRTERQPLLPRATTALLVPPHY